MYIDFPVSGNALNMQNMSCGASEAVARAQLGQAVTPHLRVNLDASFHTDVDF